MSRHRDISAATVAVRAIGIVLAVGFAFLALRAVLVESAAPAAVRGSRLVGQHPAIALAVARDASVGEQARALLPSINRAAHAEPLAPEPFLLMASIASASGDGARVGRMLRETLDREPRLRQARLLALEHDSRAGDAAAMADQIVILSRLMPNANEVLVASLAQLVIDRSTRRATIDALDGNPLVHGVLNYLTAAKADTDLVLLTARARPPGPIPPGNDWQSRLVGNLVEARQYRRAYDVWAGFMPDLSADQRSLIYNADFASTFGSPPFNWAFASGRVGAAEPGTNGSLEVNFFGRESGVLAEQLLILSPGSHALTFVVEGDSLDGAGDLQWVMTCAETGAAFASVPITDISFTPRRIRQTILVPASNCAAQWLRLTGRAGDFGRPRNARISELGLSKGGGQ